MLRSGIQWVKKVVGRSYCTSGFIFLHSWEEVIVLPVLFSYTRGKTLHLSELFHMWEDIITMKSHFIVARLNGESHHIKIEK